MDFNDLDRETQVMLATIAGAIATYNLTSDRDREQLYNQISDLVRALNADMEDVVPYEIAYGYFNGFDDGGLELDLNADSMAIDSDGNIKSEMNTIVHVEALEALVEDTMLDLKAAYRTYEQNAIDSIENVVAELKLQGSNRIVTGADKEQLIKQVQQAFLKEGMTAFTTRDGKQLPLDFYARTVANTKLAQADVQGHLSRYTEANVDLVEVIGHPFSCEHCAAHKGMVYSISGNHPDYPKLPKDLIPFHPNCRCSLSPIIESSLTPTERKKIDERVSKGVDYDIRTKHEVEKYEEAQAINQRNNAEKKLFSRMQTELGADMPESLAAFRRMKRSNSLKYQELFSNYLSATHTKS